MSDPIDVTAPTAAIVSHVEVAPGDTVRTGDLLASVEVMKMEHAVRAETDGTVDQVLVAVGDQVEEGDRLLRLLPGRIEPDEPTSNADVPAAPEPGSVRPDLNALLDRRARLDDARRPEATRTRHERGHRTVRENVADLLDEGSFAEYGGLAVAAQRSRRSMEELIERTPADGLVTGTGTVNADRFGPKRSRVAVAAYDYTVLAGTQGWTNHHKKDRLFTLAERLRLPVVVFAEGGGGRPGDTDVTAASWLDAEAFHLFARLSGRVPLVAIVNGRCFAGNAALAGCADLLIVTEDSNLGMAGPAMIEGGGLGTYAPEDIGPTEVHRASGVADVVVEDETEAVAVARQFLGYLQGSVDRWSCADQRALREAVPANRREVYDMRALLHLLADADSVLEVRPDAAAGAITAFARIEGRPVGIVANNPHHLGGAIDAAAADSMSRFLSLCDAHDLPVVVLCDTPGFMVGPQAEEEAGVRRFGRLFVTGANLEVPIVCVVTRKAYGLGAQAMMGGHLKVPIATLAWPTGELGPMGLEGAVRLGFRRELEAIDDPDERAAREQALIDLAHANADALNVATFAEIDDVIDPAETRQRIVAALDLRPPAPRQPGRRRQVDPW